MYEAICDLGDPPHGEVHYSTPRTDGKVVIPTLMHCPIRLKCAQDGMGSDCRGGARGQHQLMTRGTADGSYRYTYA